MFTRETLIALEALTEAAWKTPFSTRADSLANYNHTWAEEDDLIVEPLVDDAAALSEQDIRRIEKIALSEPELVGRLVSRDGKVAGLAISFALPDNPDARSSRSPTTSMRSWTVSGLPIPILPTT